MSEDSQLDVALPANEKSYNLQLHKDVLDLYQKDHTKINETWEYLEKKAQVNITIAGVFVAVTFGMIDRATHFEMYDKVFLFILVVFIAKSILYSVRVLRARHVPLPYFGEVNKNKLILIINKLTWVTEDVYETFIFEQIDDLKRVNDHYIRINAEKSEYLKLSQIFLIIAVTMAIVFTIGTIFRR